MLKQQNGAILHPDHPVVAVLANRPAAALRRRPAVALRRRPAVALRRRPAVALCRCPVVAGPGHRLVAVLVPAYHRPVNHHPVVAQTAVLQFFYPMRCLAMGLVQCKMQ